MLLKEPCCIITSKTTIETCQTISKQNCVQGRINSCFSACIQNHHGDGPDDTDDLATTPSGPT